MSLERYGRILTADPDYFYNNVIPAARQLGSRVGKRVKEILAEEPSFPGTGGTKKLPLGPPNKKRKLKVSLKKMGKAGNTVNALAGKASMVRVRKKAARGRFIKKIKVPKKLKKQISQVLKAKMIYGSYETCRINMIGTGHVGTTGTKAEQPRKAVLGMANQLVAVFPAAGSGTGHNRCCWLVGLNNNSSSRVSNANSGNYDVNDIFMYFHPLKFLDAASVLWNNKAISENWSNETNNITTRADSSGVPDQTVPQNFKLDVVNSFVTFELKNLSTRELTVQIFHVKSKRKATPTLALDQWNLAADQDLYNNGYMKQAVGQGVLSNPLISPGDSLSFKQNNKYETVTIVIKPGETCKHSLQGPKNTVIDFGKLLGNGMQDINNFISKDTVQCIFTVIPDMQMLVDATTGAASTVTGHAGHYIPAQASDDDLFATPLAVKVKEFYRLRCPENAGFLTRTVAAGSGQPLNLRRTIKAFGNFADKPVNEAGAKIFKNDEENPLFITSSDQRG